MHDITSYLSGEKLFGDDFTDQELKQWFADEAEGYANLGAKNKIDYTYNYHALNNFHAFSHLHRSFPKALGIGSAYGEELKPIADIIEHITILDPSDAFSGVTYINNTPCTYKKPNSNGSMDFNNETFDLITSFGVMHHIANVTYVMSECYRCLKDGGTMLLREPIVSMGDWTKPRPHLTKRERGIPIKLMDNIVNKVGFTITRRAYCVFPALPKISDQLSINAYNNPMLTRIDFIVSSLFAWNMKYHRTKLFEKFAPVCICYILQK